MKTLERILTKKKPVVVKSATAGDNNNSMAGGSPAHNNMVGKENGSFYANYGSDKEQQEGGVKDFSAQTFGGENNDAKLAGRGVDEGNDNLHLSDGGNRSFKIGEIDNLTKVGRVDELPHSLIGKEAGQQSVVDANEKKEGTSTGIAHSPMNDGGVNSVSAENDNGRTAGGGVVYRSYEDIIRASNPAPTVEDEEKEQKRRKTQRIVAGVGDMLSALSNLYFTHQYAPSMYDGRNSMSERLQRHYDEMDAQKENNRRAYMASLMRAKQADDEQASKERNWRRRLALDAYRMNKDRADAEAKEREREYKTGRDRVADEKWNKEQEARNNRFKAEQAMRGRALAQRAKENEARVKAKAKSGSKKNVIVFSDGANSKVAIDDRVWRGSVQSVFDILRREVEEYNSELEKDSKEQDSKEQGVYDFLKKYHPELERSSKGNGSKRGKVLVPAVNASQQDKENFVKQYWHLFPNSSVMMQRLSEINPDNVESKIEDEVGNEVEKKYAEREYINKTNGKEFKE